VSPQRKGQPRTLSNSISCLCRIPSRTYSGCPSPQSQEGHEQGTLGSRWSCDGCCTALRWDGRCTSGQLSSRDKTSCLDANSCPTWSPGKQLISNTPWVVAQPWRSSSLVGVQGRTKEFGMFADPNTACWCLDVAAADGGNAGPGLSALGPIGGRMGGNGSSRIRWVRVGMTPTQ